MDMYVPLFTMLEFIFYFGWLKVTLPIITSYFLCCLNFYLILLLPNLDLLDFFRDFKTVCKQSIFEFFLLNFNTASTAAAMIQLSWRLLCLNLQDCGIIHNASRPILIKHNSVQ
jgi:hypothetical protein